MRTDRTRRLPPVLAMLLVLAVPVVPAHAAPDSPNVVLILADDLGYQGLGCFGSDLVETPNLDRLAAEGQRWTRAYAGMSTCAPSRSVLMSGQYTTRTGVWRVADRHTGEEDHIRFVVPELAKHLPADVPTLGEAFRRAGYRTGMFGKWHLGRGDHHPSQRGFDVAIESSKKHFDFETDPGPNPQSDPPVAEGTYLSDYLADRAIDFIETSHTAERPFFLYFPDFLVHKPLEAKRDLEKQFKEKLGPDVHPEVVKVCAMTASLDASVGRLIDGLEGQGILDQTLIVFTSDNGGYKVKGDDPALFNRPLRSYKGQQYEGGLRVPVIFRWPGQVPAGAVTDAPLHFVDLYPTLLDLAGAATPAGHALDGMSLAPVLRGEAEAGPERGLFWFFPKYAGYNAKTGRWRDEWRNTVLYGSYKLTEYVESQRFELYDLAADAGEQNDLATRRPELLEAMRERLEAGKRRFGAPVPVPNPAYAGG